MHRIIEIKFLILITLFNLLQSVRFTIQRPQSRDSGLTFGEFFDTSNQYDDVVPSDDEVATDITEKEPILQPFEKRNTENLQDDSNKYSQGMQKVDENMKRTKRNIIENFKFNNIVPMDNLPFVSYRKKRSLVESDDKKKRELSWNFGWPFLWRNKRDAEDDASFENQEMIIEDSEEENHLSNDRLPYVLYRHKRNEDSEEKPNDENKTALQYISPNGVSVPLINIQHFDKQTEINATISNVKKTPKDALSVDDVLSIVRNKRSADNEIENLEIPNGREEIIKVSDLDVAESSVVFKPLFRYRSQVSERRRVFSDSY